MKLDWKAESKVGSLDNAKYKPGGGEKRVSMVFDAIIVIVSSLFVTELLSVATTVCYSL